MRIIDHFREVIRVVSEAHSPAEACGTLMRKFAVSERQAKVMLDLQVVRLCQMERTKIRDELLAIQEYLAEQGG